jgi:hypothetical protein
MQPAVLQFHWTFGIGIIQSMYLAFVHPPTLMRAVYTGTALVNMYHHGIRAQLQEPSRQTMRLYIPDDEQCTIVLSRAAKWASRGLHATVVVMDIAYIVLITENDLWLTMMMFMAVSFYPVLKLMRWFVPDINTTIAQRLMQSRRNNHETRTPVHAEYSLLDDSDHRDAVHQRFMLKQVPRMLAMIAMSACHMALMLDARDTCAYMKTMNTSNAWLC